MEIGERKAGFTGIGQSTIGRRLGKHPLTLTAEAIFAAVEDAGLTLADIDGLATYPGREPNGGNGHGPVGAGDVKEALGLELNWYSGSHEGPAQLQAVFNAAAAIAAGYIRHAVIFRTLYESSSQTPERRASNLGTGGGRIDGMFQYYPPFNATSAANWLGISATRHMHEHGITREQLAWIALNGRANAARNPTAIFRSPLTMDDYLNSRMISTPFCLFDCDIPCDGSIALVLSAMDSTSGLRKQPLRIEAVGSAFTSRNSWDQEEAAWSGAAPGAAKRMWERTTLTPKDVDVAQLYDGFSWIALNWLEALGFCGRGESGAFIDGGKNIALDGILPLNTNGGQLSAGRMHGYGYLHEACVQLWGEGGERQAQKDVRVACVAAGGGPLGGSLLIVRD